MAENLLEVRNLVVNVEDKEILHNINLDIKPGETHVLMGPNGAGKSTLGYALMGNPKYTVKGGSINFAGDDITKLAVDKRAKAGLFLSFQNPLEVPGISLSSFLKTALEQQRGVRIKAWDFRCVRLWLCCRWTANMPSVILTPASVAAKRRRQKFCSF